MATKHDTGRDAAQGSVPEAAPSITIPLAIRPESRPEVVPAAVLPPEDIALSRELLPAWREHQGEHVLIHGGAVHGFLPTRRDARREGFRLFGPVAFLVKQVDLDEKPRPAALVIR